MSERDHDELDREDLVARARRGLLSAGEHARLSRVLAGDPTLRAAHRVGVELDRAGAVQGGDDALVARAADAAIARAAEMTSRTRAAHASSQLNTAHAHAPTRDAARASTRAAAMTRWAAAAAVGLSVIFASGVATALFAGAMPWPFRRAASPASEPAPAPISARKAKASRKDVSRAAPEAPLPTAERAALAPVEAPLARKPSVTPSVTPAERAAGLFHEANNARRDGDLPRARRLYGQLIATHPSSDEAGLARVSLGRLLLAAGDARGAERELRRYLASGGGQLQEEALVGQAQSLGLLGRTGEERAAWKRLLEAHPRSVYAAQAKQRLAELDAAPQRAAGEGAR